MLGKTRKVDNVSHVEVKIRGQVVLGHIKLLTKKRDLNDTPSCAPNRIPIQGLNH